MTVLQEAESSISRSFDDLQLQITQQIVDLNHIQSWLLRRQQERMTNEGALRPAKPQQTSSMLSARRWADAIPLFRKSNAALRESSRLIAPSIEKNTPTTTCPTSTLLGYYDGDVQSLFLSMVNSIGAARTSFRTTRLSNVGARRTDSCRLKSNPYLCGPREIHNKPSYDWNIDVTLERSQSLCERAAHQTLRTGDCQEELGAVSEIFSDLLKTIPAASQAAVAAERQSKRQDEQIDSRPTIVAPLNMQTARSPVLGLEVDDEDDDEDFEQRLRAMRSTYSQALVH